MKTKSKLISFFFASLAASCGAAEITISAGDPGTTSSGSWFAATGAGMPFNGNQGVYTLAGGGVETYTFSALIPESTLYTVQVYNSCYTPRSHQVIHEIKQAGVLVDTQLIEQDCLVDPFVGQWRTLGSYNFTAGSTASLTIDTTNSDNVYIGATAARFVYNASNTNALPSITTTTNQLTVNEGDLVQISATAQDAEDGNLTSNIQWSGLAQSGNGSSFSLTAGNADFTITASVTDSAGASVNQTVNVTVQVAQPPGQNVAVTYNFDCTTPLQPLVGFTSNNSSALPNVGMRCGRYVAELLDNSNNRTLHFNNLQGRLDAVLLSFPFRVIARNLGIAPMNDPTAVHQPQVTAFNFVGLQIHHQDLNSRNSAHLVVGQRGGTINTLEGKTTLNGVSQVGDIGYNALSTGRADLMILGQSDGSLSVFWQQPNLTGSSANDNWIAYQDNQSSAPGLLPGTLPDWGGNSVYVGIITYAQDSNGVPFMGVMDSFEVVE